MTRSEDLKIITVSAPLTVDKIITGNVRTMSNLFGYVGYIMQRLEQSYRSRNHAEELPLLNYIQRSDTISNFINSADIDTTLNYIDLDDITEYKDLNTIKDRVNKVFDFMKGKFISRVNHYNGVAIFERAISKMVIGHEVFIKPTSKNKIMLSVSFVLDMSVLEEDKYADRINVPCDECKSSDYMELLECPDFASRILSNPDVIEYYTTQVRTYTYERYGRYYPRSLWNYSSGALSSILDFGTLEIEMPTDYRS